MGKCSEYIYRKTHSACYLGHIKTSMSLLRESKSSVSHNTGGVIFIFILFWLHVIWVKSRRVCFIWTHSVHITAERTLIQCQPSYRGVLFIFTLFWLHAIWVKSRRVCFIRTHSAYYCREDLDSALVLLSSCLSGELNSNTTYTLCIHIMLYIQHTVFQTWQSLH